jgi:ABC-2 type transport system ATP-binding protein
MIVGLDRPSAGSVTVNGRPYTDLQAPLHDVGTLLEASAVHTSRSEYDHLRALAATHGISRARVDEVIVLVRLTDVARTRAGGFSLGLGQRLSIATALLGDPPTVVLDEPVNGLDPEGIRWVRDLLKGWPPKGGVAGPRSTLSWSAARMRLVALRAGRPGRDRGDLRLRAPVVRRGLNCAGQCRPGR